MGSVSKQCDRTRRFLLCTLGRFHAYKRREDGIEELRWCLIRDLPEKELKDRVSNVIIKCVHKTERKNASKCLFEQLDLMMKEEEATTSTSSTSVSSALPDTIWLNGLSAEMLDLVYDWNILVLCYLPAKAIDQLRWNVICHLPDKELRDRVTEVVIEHVPAGESEEALQFLCGKLDDMAIHRHTGQQVSYGS
jgi:hypothetical protein